MSQFPLQNPSPDFQSLEQVLKGEKEPDKVYFADWALDGEMVRYIIENLFGEKAVPITDGTLEARRRQDINFYYRMGYDYVQSGPSFQNMPQFKSRKTANTAALAESDRTWVEEGGGIIKNWEDFEKVGWDNIKHNLQGLEQAEKYLPEGMKITVGTTAFEMILENFLGYEDLFILSHDNPQLVEAVFQQWGQKIYNAYEEAVQHPKVGAIFHADDLGFKTATIMSPEFLRKNVFPWFKKYASLAHEQGKTYWYHCCGNVLDVMDDLIEDVKIDAFHSFQDVIIPIDEFMTRYPQVAALGGIDVDNLGRMSEQELRKCVRDTLAKCMPGKYALGSGSSVTNYTPPQNYLAMMEEGVNWRG